MKPLLSLLIALSLLFGCGCAGETAGVQPPSGTPPDAGEEPLPSEGPECVGVPLPAEAASPETAGEDTQSPLSQMPEPADSDFVRVADYIPTIQVDLAYAGAENFTGQAIYDFADAYLRYGTAKKLAAVQDQLAAQGLGLLIWDAFRPTAAQFKLWEVCPNPVYVANPEKGFSAHSRGNTVDVTLVSLDGTDVEMPTGFDDFSPLADRDYSDVPAAPAANAKLLEDAMSAAGFLPYQGEWWHFSDQDTYDVETAFSPQSEYPLE